MRRKIIQKLQQLFDKTNDTEIAEAIRKLKLTSEDVDIDLIKDKYDL